MAPTRLYTQISGCLVAVLIVMLSAGSAWAEWKEIIVHHTATPKLTKSGKPYPQFTKAVCDEKHRERGWDECGYNWLIERCGRIYRGRTLDKPGAHTLGRNSDAIGIAFVMDGRYEELTQRALDSFRVLKMKLEAHFGRELPVTGHRDHRATVCPTDAVWDRIEEYV